MENKNSAATQLNDAPRVLKLCIQHKWELVKRGYGSAEAFGQLPEGTKKTCGICNGEWKMNYDLSQIESAAHP